MTEEEMKTTWCPMARVQVPGGLVNRISRAMWRILKLDTDDYNYHKDIEADCKCLGSGCGMWRWDDGYAATPPKTHGYCGLAGKPS